MCSLITSQPHSLTVTVTVQSAPFKIEYPGKTTTWEDAKAGTILEPNHTRPFSILIYVFFNLMIFSVRRILFSGVYDSVGAFFSNHQFLCTGNYHWVGCKYMKLQDFISNVILIIHKFDPFCRMTTHTMRLSVANGTCWNRNISECLLCSCESVKCHKSFLLVDSTTWIWSLALA